VVLNMISTAVFTRLGHTYRGRMVDVRISNDKLRARAERTVVQLAGVERDVAARTLVAAGGSAKVAVLMLRRGLSAEEAHDLLASNGGDLASLLTEVRP
ncbi:MAG TPA: hypothetical protein VJT78_03675, partial [Candidatus Dormibacteraeota bacterium]|nr:hypothetical protein [Candidatus Dormibacteraeota bacterium]